MAVDIFGPGGEILVFGAVEGDPDTLMALRVDSEGKVYLAGTISLQGAVSLDQATLDALEEITVALDGPSLAALETVTVGGEVSLAPASLAALEEITANLADADVALLAKERTLNGKLGAVIPIVGTHALADGPQVLWDPSPDALRVSRIWIKGSHALGDTAVEFELRLGAVVLDHDEIVGDQAYANGSVREGPAGDLLTLELLSAGKVFYNIAIQEFTP